MIVYFNFGQRGTTLRFHEGRNAGDTNCTIQIDIFFLFFRGRGESYRILPWLELFVPELKISVHFLLDMSICIKILLKLFVLLDCPYWISLVDFFFFPWLFYYYWFFGERSCCVFWLPIENALNLYLGPYHRRVIDFVGCLIPTSSVYYTLYQTRVVSSANVNFYLRFILWRTLYWMLEWICNPPNQITIIVSFKWWIKCHFLRSIKRAIHLKPRKSGWRFIRNGWFMLERKIIPVSSLK